jgi:hypothetical protein
MKAYDTFGKRSGGKCLKSLVEGLKTSEGARYDMAFAMPKEPP